MGSKAKKVLAIITLLIFVITTFLVYSNLHFHIVDSHYVIHGHPFQKKSHNAASAPCHQHSAAGFLFYSSIFNIASLFFLLLIIFILLFVSKFTFNPQSFYYYIPTYSFPFLRAPPLAA
ncbi:hypothetical protein B6D60_02190 [candidate division KSB1 bacterium 4484_87]|nr:MAG: hypothetical protein B6D60_02190 [candidate division KSB1 bacterium 4484_87]